MVGDVLRDRSRKAASGSSHGRSLSRVTTNFSCACAREVCRTDLHVAEGDLPVHRPGVTPGHELVGVMAGLGFEVGERVGVAWLGRTDGTCADCVRGSENLCPASRCTGWDADGGYAQYTVVPAAFAYWLPGRVGDVSLAPLLCAGIIGHRALRWASLPPGGRLGLYGFGGSAHLCAQVALTGGATVHVLTRDASARKPALELGAASARDSREMPPEPLDSAILFAPVSDVVPLASNTREDGREFAGRFDGAAVLVNDLS
ncbi:zinc-binding alcohol dehydrogenase family protein [Streptomyces canus]|uniref:zinc-binding alcohol dehydrogenase family protein n=1 Tax=Streptomyces canus TaxID=58343 RepID=UPI00372349F3